MSLLDAIAEQPKKDEFVLCPGNEINVPFGGGAVILGDVGLELEIEGMQLPRDPQLGHIRSPETNRFWRAIDDGSLRGEAKEYVLSGPIHSSEIRDMVDGLFTIIRSMPGGLIANSNRCSTHVHVNVSNLKVNHVTSAILLWCTFQTPLIAWCGEERVANHFCLSARDEESMADGWYRFLRTGERPLLNGMKYTALNLIPIFTQGSLEFRSGGAPDHEDKVVWWAKICNAIVRYAADNYENPYSLGYALSEQGPEVILRKVLEYAKLGPLTTERIFNELTADGMLHINAMRDFRDVQALIYAFPWDDLLPKINTVPVPNPFSKAKNKAPNRIRHVDFGARELAVPPAPLVFNEVDPFDAEDD
jgi:hypothetical protein